MKSARWIVLGLFLWPLAAMSQNIDEKLLDWAFPTRHQKGGPQYSQSEAVSVTLGVWDKVGAGGTNDAEFVVTCPNGQPCRAKAKLAKMPEWLEVRFPEDFTDCTCDAAGEYTWTCLVGGKTVLRGRFQYATTFSTARWKAGPGK